MKTKKIIVFIITIIVFFGLTFKSYATEETGGDTTETSNPVTDTPTENDMGNENQNTDNDDNSNQNENPGNQENTPQEPTGEENTNPGTDNQENSNTENNENNNEIPNQSNENNGNSNSGNSNNNNSSGRTSNYSSNSSNNATVESSNANLKYLSVDVEGLSPEFSKSVTEYYLVIDLNVESINVEALAEDAKAQVTITGNNDLTEGENTIRITVKAENENTKTYVINVTKTDDVERTNANLKALSVNGFNIYPSFKSNIYNYSLTLNEKITQLEILAETENEEATFEIVGNENLEEGDNLIKIVVTAKDGEAKREYKINAYISTQNIKTKASNTKQAIVILAVLGVAIAGISFALYKKKQ